MKWSAIFFLPVFLLLLFFWGVGLRRTVGAAHPWRDTLLDEAGWLFAVCGWCWAPTWRRWTGWFVTDTGWKRHYLAVERGEPEPPVIGALRNLWYYHADVLRFHEGLSTPHQYQSWPWQWLLLARPVAFYWNGDVDCGAAQCASEILLLGTPVLWWAFLPALAGLAWFGISRRDWRAAAIGAGVFAGIAPWFYYELKQRTMFFFYAAAGRAVPGAGRRLLPGRAHQGTRGRPTHRWPRPVAVSACRPRTVGCTARSSRRRSSPWSRSASGGTTRSTSPRSCPTRSWMRRMLLGNRWV